MGCSTMLFRGLIIALLMSLKLNWCKSYGTKWKYAVNAKSQKNGNGNLLVCVTTFEPIEI